MCKTRIPVAVRVLCICICLIIFLGASSVGRVDWYYRSVEMVIRDGYTFLKREYGPLHLLSPIYIAITLGCGLLIVANVLRKKKHVSYSVSVGSLCLLILCSATFVGERMVGLKVELLPIAYTVCAGGILEVCYSVPEMYRKKLHCIRIWDDTPQQQYLKLVEQYNEELGVQVKEKTARLVEVQNDIIVSMASIVENRDNNTGGNIRRTSDVVRAFVEHLLATDYSSTLTREIADQIIKAAPLHDFGKIAIPDSILNKPGKFVSEEYEIMKLHAKKGAEIVARILQNSDDLQFKNIAVNVAHYHHEKWDGTGYPCGLVQEEIPLEARIMALADVFDALVSNRVYKGQFSFDEAFGIIEESSGSHFDPSLCKAFLQCRLQIETLYG